MHGYDINITNQHNIKFRTAESLSLATLFDVEHRSVYLQITTDHPELQVLIDTCKVKLNVETPIDGKWFGSVCSGRNLVVYSKLLILTVDTFIRNIPNDTLIFIRKNLLAQSIKIFNIRLLSVALSRCGGPYIVVGDGQLNFNISDYMECGWRLPHSSNKYIVITIIKLDLAVTERLPSRVSECMCGAQHLKINNHRWCGYHIPSHLVFVKTDVKISIKGLDKSIINSHAEIIRFQRYSTAPISLATIQYQTKTLPTANLKQCPVTDQYLIANYTNKLSATREFFCHWLCLMENQSANKVLQINIKVYGGSKSSTFHMEVCENNKCIHVKSQDSTYTHVSKSPSAELFIHGSKMMIIDIFVDEISSSGCGGPYYIKVLNSII